MPFPSSVIAGEPLKLFEVDSKCTPHMMHTTECLARHIKCVQQPPLFSSSHLQIRERWFWDPERQNSPPLPIMSLKGMRLESRPGDALQPWPCLLQTSQVSLPLAEKGSLAVTCSLSGSPEFPQSCPGRGLVDGFVSPAFLLKLGQALAQPIDSEKAGAEVYWHRADSPEKGHGLWRHADLAVGVNPLLSLTRYLALGRSH